MKGALAPARCPSPGPDFGLAGTSRRHSHDAVQFDVNEALLSMHAFVNRCHSAAVRRSSQGSRRVLIRSRRNEYGWRAYRINSIRVQTMQRSDSPPSGCISWAPLTPRGPAYPSRWAMSPIGNRSSRLFMAPDNCDATCRTARAP